MLRLAVGARGLKLNDHLILVGGTANAHARPKTKTTKKISVVRPLFMVPRSRSQMFLTFVSPPKDQDADVRFLSSV